ncbi:MAG: hypothetical protein ACRDTE_34045 [Pseudonocardiaceae bacterium]
MSDVAGVGSIGWRHRSALSGADLIDFVALRRVHGRPDSGVVQMRTISWKVSARRCRRTLLNTGITLRLPRALTRVA